MLYITLYSHLRPACTVGEDDGCLTTEEPRDKPDETPEDPEETPGPGHTFFLRPKGAYWTAVADCKRFGGNLACPRNSQQQQKIASIIRLN